MSALDDYLRDSDMDCDWGGRFHTAACDELAALRHKLAEYESEIGDPPEGSHPDERKPRAATWHQERLNWVAELAALRAEVTRLTAKVAKADDSLNWLESVAQSAIRNQHAVSGSHSLISNAATAREALVRLAAYRSAP